jgi:ankyrin repeat protein
MWELLVEAIIAQDLKQFKYLFAISDPYEFERKNIFGKTLLLIAARQGSSKICELLISKMSIESINIIDSKGNTALTWAAAKGMERVCKLLIPKMSSDAINAIDKQGTALIWAAVRGMESVCKLLIPLTSSEAISVLDEQGSTALACAAQNSMERICKLLIPRMSADAISVIDTQGNTALIWAIKHKMNEVCIDLVFLSNQKSLNNLTSDKSTALSLAIYRDMDLLSKLLIPLTSVKAIKASKIYSKTLLKYAKSSYNKDLLYKMLFAKVNYAYSSAFDNVNNGSDNIKALKKSIFQLADFIIKSFSNSDKPIKIEIKDFSKFKFYQQINKDLLESCIYHLGENGVRLLKKVDEYIICNYFALAGINKKFTFKKIDEKNHFIEDCVNLIFSGLGCPSLLAINTVELDRIAKVHTTFKN